MAVRNLRNTPCEGLYNHIVILRVADRTPSTPLHTRSRLIPAEDAAKAQQGSARQMIGTGQPLQPFDHDGGSARVCAKDSRIEIDALQFRGIGDA